jgi:hypothetical protein
MRREVFLLSLRAASGWRLPSEVASALTGRIRDGDDEVALRASEWRIACGVDALDEFREAMLYAQRRQDLSLEARLLLADRALESGAFDARLIEVVEKGLAAERTLVLVFALRPARKLLASRLPVPAIESLVASLTTHNSIAVCAAALDALQPRSGSWLKMVRNALRSPSAKLRLVAIDLTCCEIECGRFDGLESCILAALEDPIPSNVGRIVQSLLRRPAECNSLLTSENTAAEAARHPRVKAVVDFLKAEMSGR